MSQDFKSIIGIQVSSVKPFLKTSDEVNEAFEKFKASGFNYAQLQWIDPSVDDNDIKNALVKNDIISVSSQDYYHVIRDNKEAYINTCLVTGTKDLTVSGIPEQYMSKEGCDIFAKELIEFSKILANKGLTMSFHPRSQEYVDVGGVLATDLLLEKTVGHMYLCLDGYHVHASKLEPADYIAKYHEILTGFHFKDCKIVDGKKVLAPIGQGTFNWDKTFEACIKYQVKYCYVEQESWDKDPFVSLKESLDYLLSTGYYTTA